MARPDGLIEFPDGSAIWYFDEDHSYWRAEKVVQEHSHEPPFSYEWRKSRRLTGASTLAKVANYDSGRLLSWKERVTCEAVAAAFNDTVTRGEHIAGLDWLVHGPDILKRIREAGTDADSVRDKKATLGTNVHTVLEGLAGVCEMPNVDDLPEDEKGYSRAVMRWWEARRPGVLNAEQFVYHAEHGYAGRFDLRATFGDGPSFTHGPRYLIDLKTSGWIGPAHHVQLALYELAARACGVGATDHQMILQVKPDGTYREVWSKASQEDAEAAIAVYRGVARIEREARAAAA